MLDKGEKVVRRFSSSIRMISKIADFFHDFPAERYLVGVSGGLDSMTLLTVMHLLNLPVKVLHVNYGLRGADSDADENLVRDFCEQKGIPVVIHRENLALKLKNGGNLQDLARKVRYDFFKSQMHPTEREYIVLAHHADDQLEQFWLKLGRGANLNGLAGMKEREGNRLRPLLPFTKTELKEFALENQVIWREDYSNKKNDYQRNIWRNELFPFLDTEIPTWRDSIFLLQEKFQEHNQADENWVQKQVLEKDNNFIPRALFPEITENRFYFILKAWDLPLGWVKEWEKMKVAKTGASWYLEHGKWLMERDGLQLSFETDKALPTLIFEKVNALPQEFSKEEIFLDMKCLKGEPRLTLWQTGDRIFPIGMKGSRLVSDVLKDAHIANAAKKQQYILRDDEKILAVYGLCIDRRAIAKKDSETILRLRLG
jgi:tRNA(Ile)-lysidine synthase